MLMACHEVVFQQWGRVVADGSNHYVTPNGVTEETRYFNFPIIMNTLYTCAFTPTNGDDGYLESIIIRGLDSTGCSVIFSTYGADIPPSAHWFCTGS